MRIIMSRKILLVGLLIVSCSLWINAAEDGGPVLACSFESKEEINGLSGTFNAKTCSFVPGIKGQALKMPGRHACFFPTEGIISPKAGTLSAWIKTDWKLPDIKNPRMRLFAVMNKKQQARPIYKHNYFSILSLSFGDIKKGKPYILYMLARSTPEEQAVLLAPNIKWDANTWQHVLVIWNIGTGRKDGEFIFYLNGKMVERKTDFRAPKVELGEKLVCQINGTIDELKTWDRKLSAEEALAEYTKMVP
jgi:Concanavalin A-like lectin/glucanases superfamily